MKAISLDDIGESLQKTKKKKITVKAKTTAKKAKVVSSAPVLKKKKKIEPEDIVSPKIKRKKRSVNQEADKAEKRIKKEVKKKKSLPAKLEEAMSTGDKLEAQMVEIVNAIPDIVKQENDQIEEYQNMFHTCRKLARAAETQYFKTLKASDIYPLMQVYNQMRDIIADLRALRDVGKLGDLLNEEVLSPFAQSTASIIINVQQRMASYYKSNLNEKDIAESTRALNRAIKDAAQDITKAYHASLEKAVQVFST